MQKFGCEHPNIYGCDMILVYEWMCRYCLDGIAWPQRAIMPYVYMTPPTFCAVYDRELDLLRSTVGMTNVQNLGMGWRGQTVRVLNSANSDRGDIIDFLKFFVCRRGPRRTRRQLLTFEPASSVSYLISSSPCTAWETNLGHHLNTTFALLRPKYEEVTSTNSSAWWSPRQG